LLDRVERGRRRLFLAMLGARGVAPRGSVAVVDTRTWKVRGRTTPPGDTQTFAVSLDGGVLAVGLTDGDVVLANTAGCQVTQRRHVDVGDACRLGAAPRVGCDTSRAHQSAP
jgi:hypothetical protein